VYKRQRLFLNLKKIAGVDENAEQQQSITTTDPKEQLAKFKQEQQKINRFLMIFSSLTVFLMMVWLILTIMQMNYFGTFNIYLLVYSLIFSLLCYQQFIYQKKIMAKIADLTSKKS
jgi:uncharacterized membrane protein